MWTVIYRDVIKLRPKDWGIFQGFPFIYTENRKEKCFSISNDCAKLF